MSVGRRCVRDVCVAGPEESVPAAARRMRDRAVGTLVVVDADRRPLGLVTDRDLVVRALATPGRPAERLLRDVMSGPADTVPEDTPIEDALARMRTGGHRRLVVVGAEGRLAGIVSLDDLLALLAGELAGIGDLVAPAQCG